MANNDKTEKPAVKIEKANDRIDNDLRNVQQFAKRVAKVLTREATEEAEDEDTTVEVSQKTTGTAGQLETPQSSGSKRKTKNSIKAAKPQPTEQEKLVRAVRMRDLQEMVEETKQP